jgi:DNA (cytosine-5)-methyltransferase 1
MEEIIVDNFAGGGGASTGMELATGRIVKIAINHDPDAILMHKTNHPHTKHLQASVWDVDPVKECEGCPVGLAWFSPDCKHFSKAKGAALVDRNIRGLAWIVLRWAGTVRPRVIILENVEEFQTWGPVRRGKPVKKKAGQTFQRWKKQLSDLGYTIEHRELVAADYGAPTTRKRFVLVARCDGRPIVWPERTHDKDGADGLPKWRAAAEVIDWTQPCYSIFATKEDIKSRYGVTVVRPLADNTMRRVIRGVDKFVIRAETPYIVPWTVTNTCNSVGSQVTAPVHTVTTAGNQLLLSPALIQYHTEQSENVRGQSVTETLRTVDASNRYGLVSACLSKFYGGVIGTEVQAPMPTVTAIDHNALIAANLVEYFSTGRPISVEEPMHTVTSHDREALTLTHICEFKGQDIGQDQRKPLRTITASAGEFAEIRTEVRTYEPGADMGRWPEVRALLNRFCDYDLKENEVLTLDVGRTAYFVADIGLRMLTPRELYNAMGFPPDYIIDRDYTGRAYGKSKQVARCGNAVCPPMAEAVVRANLPEWCGKKLRTMEELERAVSA